MDLATAIRGADADHPWALLVKHEDGSLELHDHDHTAMQILDPTTLAGVDEYLLVAEPVACDEAAAAGVMVLNDCDRCA